MPAQSHASQSLIEASDSILTVIDIQDCFLNKYDRAKRTLAPILRVGLSDGV